MNRRFCLKNDFLAVEVGSLGAELLSIRNPYLDKEYLWNADPKYWKRHAPVLFPVVGNFKNKEYSYKGHTYSMGQHGFARDMEFETVSDDDNYLELILCSNSETKKIYPFDFELHVSYLLKDNRIITTWTVVNTGNEEMHFSIGGHPAFLIPENAEGEVSLNNGSSLLFEGLDSLEYKLIDENGLVMNQIHKLPLEKGRLKLSSELFDKDALIVENSGCKEVSLCDSEGKKTVTVTTNNPLFGIWSPAGKNAPFLCIEPWYGRADGADFEGLLQDREFANRIPVGAEFTGGYTIIVEE